MISRPSLQLLVAFALAAVLLPALLPCLRAGSPPPGTLLDTFAPELTANGVVYRTALTPEGGLLLAGDFATVDGQETPGLARLRPDGTLDPFFQSAVGIGSDPYLETLFPLANGRVLLTAQAPAKMVEGVRMYPRQTSLVLQSDGSLVASPYLDNLPDDLSVEPLIEIENRVFLRVTHRITRSSKLEVLDATTLRRLDYPAALNWPAVPLDLLPGSGGMWILGGASRSERLSLFRTDLEGALDPNFTPVSVPLAENAPFGGSNGYFLLPVPGDGFLLVADSSLPGFNTIGYRIIPSTRVIVFHTHDASGDRTSSFSIPTNSLTKSFVRREPDGDTLVTSPDGKSLRRYHSNGELDPAFSVPLPAPVPASSPNPSVPSGIRALPGLPDGRFSTGGTTRYLSGGTPDPAWHTPQLSRPGIVTNMSATTGGSFYLAGEFDSIDGRIADGIARFNPDGTIDPNFNLDPLVIDPKFHDVFSDGSALVSAGPEPLVLLRLHPDGSIDDTFRHEFAVRESLLEAAVDHEDRVLLLVNHREFFPTYNSLIRLLPDGARDQSHAHATRPPGPIWFGFGSARAPVEPFSAGTYFAHEWWHHEDGSRRQSLPAPFGAHLAEGWVLLSEDLLTQAERVPLLRRWHPEEGLDPEFKSPYFTELNSTVGTPAPRGTSLALLHVMRSGRILTAGTLATKRGDYRTLRLHPDGTPDFAFAAPAPHRVRPDLPGLEYLLSEGRLEFADLAHRRLRADFTSALELPNGTILVGGNFTHLGSAPRTGLAALCPGVATTFDVWCPATFARTEIPNHLVGPSDDPDNDQASNFYEFAVGSDPLTPEFDEIQPRLIGLTPPRWSVPRNPDAAGIELNVEISSDLHHWRVATREEATVEEAGTRYLVTLHGTAEQLFVRASFSISTPIP